MIKKSLSKKILNKRSCDRFGRSPVNLISCLFLFFSLFFLFPQNILADVNTTSTIISDKVNSFDENVNYIIKNYKNDSQIVEVLYYTSSPVDYDKDTNGATAYQWSYVYDIYEIDGKTSRVVESNWGLNVAAYASSEIEANLGFENYECSFKEARINNVVEGSDIYSPIPVYDKNNLNEYPVNTINITSPEKESNIKTNDSYFNVVIKGKIGIDFSESLFGNALFPMTPEMIGKYIRRDFRYSVDGDIEDENNLTYLGVGNKGFSNYLIEYLNQFYQDISVDVDKNKVGDINTNWTIGVTGNMNDWSEKHYYNFIINTRLWCGYLNNNLNYKFSFTVPTAFSGGLTDVDPSEYKTIVIDNYSLSRGLYVDDDFDGIDDTSFEVIPDSEIEIIHPSLFPSTSTPNNFNDGDVVQNNNNIINVNSGSEISAEEKNGILNILDNGIRKTTTLLSNLKNSMTSLGDTLQGLFDLLPEPISYLFYSALCLSLIFFILSLRR